MDRKYIQNKYPNEKFKEHPDRNYGLVALSDEGRADMDKWTEGPCKLNVDTKMVDFSVFTHYDDIKDFEQSCDWIYEGDEAEEMKRSIPAILFEVPNGIDIECYNVEDSSTILEFIDWNMGNNSDYFMVKGRDDIYGVLY